MPFPLLLSALLLAQAAPVVTVRGKAPDLMEYQNYVIEVREPASWTADWDILACQASRLGLRYVFYEWRPKSPQPFAKIDRFEHTRSRLEKRKKIKVHGKHFLPEGDVKFTYTQYPGETTGTAVGRCKGREVEFLDEPQLELTLGLKWDADARLCRWKGVMTQRHKYRSYFFPERFAADEQDVAITTFQMPGGMRLVGISFYDEDDFLMGKQSFKFYLDTDMSGWFGDGEAESICKKSRKLKFYPLDDTVH